MKTLAMFLCLSIIPPILLLGIGYADTENAHIICSKGEDTLSEAEMTFIDDLKKDTKDLKVLALLYDWIEADGSRIERGHQRIQSLFYSIIHRNQVEYLPGEEPMYEKTSNLIKLLPEYSPEAAVYREVLFVVANSLKKYGIDKAREGLSGEQQMNMILNDQFFKIMQESVKISNAVKYSIIEITVNGLKSDKWETCQRRQLWSFFARLIGGSGPYYPKAGSGIEGSEEMKTELKQLASQETEPSVQAIAKKVMEAF